MRPNTLHSVFTPTHSICHGGHFYATSTLADTCYGLLHTFLERDLTNCLPRDETRMVLGRLLVHIYEELMSCGGKVPHPLTIHS